MSNRRDLRTVQQERENETARAEKYFVLADEMEQESIQLRAEVETLKAAIIGSSHADWTVANLAALAAAHRSDSEYMDEHEDARNNQQAEEENQRFRKALQSIANNSCCAPCREAALVARQALAQPASTNAVDPADGSDHRLTPRATDPSSPD